MICGKEIAHYINRTENPSGLRQKSGLRRILFDEKSGLWRMVPIKKFLFNYSGMHLI